MRYFFVGIKGAGMTALACSLKAQGHVVEGSDVTEHFFSDDILASAGIQVHRGFKKNNIQRPLTAVVYSTAYSKKKHPELREATRLGIALMSYPEFLAGLMRNTPTIAVAGSHGKTTTTALLGFILKEAGLKPAVIAGSVMQRSYGDQKKGKPRWLVIEADEYQDKLLYYFPRHCILLNVDYDHPDYFKTPREYRVTFKRFLDSMPPSGSIVANGDESVIRAMLKKRKRNTVLFGRGKRNDIRLLSAGWRKNGAHITLVFQKTIIHLQSPLAGGHNALNIAAAAAMSRQLNIPWSVIRRSVRTFHGVKRRFEIMGSYRGAVCIEDYAHHPTEIQATIRETKERYPKSRIILVFQPHTFSRTKRFLRTFARALRAERVFILPIYSSAREKSDSTISGQDIVRLLPQKCRGEYVPTVGQVVVHLRKEVQKGDVVLLLGAGTAWRVTRMLLLKRHKGK